VGILQVSGRVQTKVNQSQKQEQKSEAGLFILQVHRTILQVVDHHQQIDPIRIRKRSVMKKRQQRKKAAVAAAAQKEEEQTDARTTEDGSSSLDDIRVNIDTSGGADGSYRSQSI